MCNGRDMADENNNKKLFVKLFQFYIWLTVCIAHKQHKMLLLNRQQIPQMLK